MGPMIFNIYVADLQTTMTNRCHHHTDDTTLYAHAKLSQLDECISSIKSDLVKLEDWAEKWDLAIDPTKTKCMVISTKQMSTAHSLDSFFFFFATKAGDYSREAIISTIAHIK